MKRTLVAAVAVLTGTLGFIPQPASAAPVVSTAPAATTAATTTAATTAAAAAKIIWVDVKVNKAWPITRTMQFIDKYTGSRMRLGTCRANAQCIRIRESWLLPTSWAAATYRGFPVTKILLNHSRFHTAYNARFNTVLHELGHASGILAHTRTCVSLMYASLNCPNGNISPKTFTTAERKILKRN